MRRRNRHFDGECSTTAENQDILHLSSSSKSTIHGINGTAMKKSSTDGDGNTVGVHFMSGGPPSFLRRWRCLLGTLLAVLVAAAIALCCYSVFTYLKAEAMKKVKLEDANYLKQLVNVVNSAKDARWKARYNPFGIRVQDFNHKNLKNLTAIKDYITHLENFFKSERMQEHLKQIEEFPDSKLPRHFDARERWPLCPTIHSVPNQGACGSCYAVAAMAVAADRTCIHTNGTQRSHLSALDVIECCPVCGNCYGGDPLKAMVYWALEGVVTGGADGCRPYEVSTECTPCSPDIYGIEQKKRKCRQDKCHQGYYRSQSYSEDKHKGSIAYTMFPRKMSIDQAGNNRVMMPSVIGHFNKTAINGKLTTEQIRNIIRKELILFGPTTLALPLTEEFLHYDSGIFHPYPKKDFENRIIYWHVVRLIGWGHDANDKLYWIAVNSFGEQWGENGLFKVDTSLLEHFGLEYETGLL